MNITFENISDNQAIKLGINNTSYIVEPQNSVEVITTDGKVVFTAELLPIDFSDAFGEDFKPKGLKERFLYKASKKFTEKIPDMGLNVAVTYEFTSKYNNAVIDVSEAGYSVADGEIADFFDMTPIAYEFPRTESTFGELYVSDAKVTNRKRFFKLYRTAQFMMVYFFFFIVYPLAKLYGSDIYIKKLLTKFYSVSCAERRKILDEKSAHLEKQEKKQESIKHGCLIGLLKICLVVLILGGLAFWVLTSEPDVIISEDFNKIVCYDETFERYNGRIPEDAKDVFLEEYYAERLLNNGEYEDEEGYYCYIYEDSDGNRYLWLQEDYNNEYNRNKTYKDYDNPKIYKSVSE